MRRSEDSKEWHRKQPEKEKDYAMKPLAVRADFDANEAVISTLWEFARRVRTIELKSPADLRLVELVDETHKRIIEIFEWNKF